jgi:hypothetical protein
MKKALWACCGKGIERERERVAAFSVPFQGAALGSSLPLRNSLTVMSLHVIDRHFGAMVETTDCVRILEADDVFRFPGNLRKQVVREAARWKYGYAALVQW